MLPIVLTILKIIGIVILVILGLVLSVLLLVLLVPVRYSLSGAYDSEIQVKAKVTWFLHAVSVAVTYENGLDVAVKILGIRLFRKKRDEMGDSETLDEMGEALGEETEHVTEEEADLGICSLGADDELITSAELSGKDDAAPDGESDTEEGFMGEDLAGDDLIFDETSTKKSRKSRRKKTPRKEKGKSSDKKKMSLSERISQITASVKEKWSRITEYKEKLTAFVTDTENQKTFRLILHQLKSMVRHILPTKVRGSLTLGLEDPYTMGNILAVLSILYAWYGEAIQITPVFDEKILEGAGTLKGRIRAGTLLVLAVRIILNKNFRVLVKRWRRNGGI